MRELAEIEGRLDELTGNPVPGTDFGTEFPVAAAELLALGLSPRQVGVHENISDSLGLLKEKGIA